MNEVLRVLYDRISTGSEPGRRTDGHTVALAIEGGGNRGCVSAGMALALHDAGLLGGFDAIYGSSSGTLTAAWMLSPDFRTGVEAWTHADSFTPYANLGNVLRRRPFLDLARLISHLYDRLGLDYEAILANPVGLHPLATDVRTAAATDLHPYLVGKRSLMAAMLASSAWPMLTGPAVRLGGRRFVDAAIAEPVPFITPLTAGCTHLLVLRSRADGHPSLLGQVRRHLGAVWISQYGRPLWAAYHQGAERAARLNVENGAIPATVLVVVPGPATRRVRCFETDHHVIAAALSAGYESAAALLHDRKATLVPAVE